MPVLKLPLNNNDTWTYMDEWNQKIKNKVSWTELYYKGKFIEAIKLEKEFEEMPNSIIIEYYLKGIGIYKTEFYDKLTGKTFDFLKFNYVQYESSK
jgi:deoxyhypusine synthase